MFKIRIGVTGEGGGLKYLAWTAHLPKKWDKIWVGSKRIDKR